MKPCFFLGFGKDDAKGETGFALRFSFCCSGLFLKSVKVFSGVSFVRFLGFVFP